MKSKRAQEQEAIVSTERKSTAKENKLAKASKKRKRGDDEVVDNSSKKPKNDKSKYNKETRKAKKLKRRNLQDLPVGIEPDDNNKNVEVNGLDTAAEEKKSNKSDEKQDEHSPDAVETCSSVKSEGKKSKKDKKKSGATKGEGVRAEDAIPEGASNGIDLDEDDVKEQGQMNGAGAGADADEGKEKRRGGKADRHIVFVGNLPYTATAASISAHFASLAPIAVRCLTNKGGDSTQANTCKGIAFVEFANVMAQRTCLDRFHHSEFDDTLSPVRKINVELTAGGGGKAPNRTDKIREKNRKLDENRVKRIEKEKAAKKEANKTGAAEVEGGGGGGGGGGTTDEQQQQHMDEQIHPSRRAQMGSGGDDNDDDDAQGKNYSYGGGIGRGRGRGGGGGWGGGSRNRGGNGGGGGGRFKGSRNR